MIDIGLNPHKQSRIAPLHELQMLTQSVASRDYVHGYISESGEQQKKSPLALLAATCSSIGKTEGKKDSREPIITTGLSPKISSGLNDVRSVVKLNPDEKSSFKPYKHLEGKESEEKQGFRAPSKDLTAHNDAVSSQTKSPEFRSKVSPHIGSGFSPFPYPSYIGDSSGHCFFPASPASRLCGMYYDIPGHAGSNSHHTTCFKSDYAGNCNSMVLAPPATSISSVTSGIRPMFPAPSVSSVPSVKSHSILPTTSPRSNPLYPRCNCGYCNQGQELKPTIQHLPQYHRDYLTSVACQDPYCTNCKSTKTSTSSSSHGQCGPLCYGHHHDSSPVLPGALPTMQTSMSHLYPYAGFMLRAQNDQNGPFVCNWVQDSKNCGKNFSTSEELLQHLRTHTNVAASASATANSLHTPCNVPGCPCGLKSAMTSPARLHSSARYHPYFMPTPPLHASTFHSAISHYATPHGIPYPSIKPY